MNNSNIDFESLRVVLESQLGRKVSLDEATKTGLHLLRIYEILILDSS